MAKLKSPILATDGVILKGGRVLLTKRNIYPFSGFWVLPGGHVEYGEKVEDAIKREMKEELGVPVKIKKLLGVYSGPKRDPRYHSVAVAYLLEIGQGKISLNHESREYKYFPLKDLPRKIGFDHRQIIKDLIKRRQKN